MSDPVPSSTLMPLTAAILRNTVGGGLGWYHGRFSTDLAYQVQLPASQSTNQSLLKAGEFDDSQVDVMTQSLLLTFKTHF